MAVAAKGAARMGWWIEEGDWPGRGLVTGLVVTVD